MWRDLLRQDEAIVSPWLGGRSLRTFDRAFAIEGLLPPAPGWQRFDTGGRKARWCSDAPPEPSVLRGPVRGYLLGDRLVPDDVRVGPELGELTRRFARVHLIEPGLDRFARVSAARAWHGGPLIFAGPELPLGPEDDVRDALFAGTTSLSAVHGVPPALDAAFRLERWRRERAEHRRREAEREARLRRVRDDLGDAALRRELAAHDFESAARAALAVGGAEYLDHAPAAAAGEMTVRFRLDGGCFACTCHVATLRIVDAGICLVDHHTGERGDARFTLESLPAVIRQAERDGVLVVFRHV